MARLGKTSLILVAAAVVAIPAGILRLACVGRSCDKDIKELAAVPFCSLGSGIRDQIAAGFREERSPDVLAVTNRREVIEDGGGVWPSSRSLERSRIPLSFTGAGVDPDVEVPAGTTLADVAPTIEAALGYVRPHPEVRTGTAIEGLWNGAAPEVVVLVMMKNVGGDEVDAAPRTWAELGSQVESGAGTLEARTGSLPIEPVAAAATLGTGGPPNRHGVTTPLVRNDRGEVTPAWSKDAPIPVIAALGDDLDESFGGDPRIALVASDAADRGLVGGNWYVESDRDDVRIVDEELVVNEAADVLRKLPPGTTALVGVSLDGSVRGADDRLSALVKTVGGMVGDRALTVVAGSGSTTPGDSFAATEIEAAIEAEIGADVVEATAAGGVFLDQDIIEAGDATEDDVIAAMSELTIEGDKVFDDVFPNIAVTFERYC